MTISSELWLSIGAVLGWGSTQVVEELRDWRRRRREQEAREIEEQALVRDRKVAYEKQTVAELREALLIYYRLLNDPTKQPGFRFGWFNSLSEQKAKLISLASAVDDEMLKGTVREIVKSSGERETWLEGGPYGPSWYETQADYEIDSAQGSLLHFFEEASCRLVTLERDLA